MSTGLTCQFIEVERERWYYLLEQDTAPSNAWDWREYCDAFGPFDDLDSARQDLRESHPNPGNSEVIRLAEGATTVFDPEGVIRRLVLSATRPLAGVLSPCPR